MKALIVIASSLLLLGCSAISGRREAISKEKENPPSTVSKDQYDQLLEKYETLLKQNQQPATPVSKTENYDKIANDLAKGDLKLSPSGKIELAETVDVFGEKGIVKNQAAIASQASPNEQTLTIEAGQIESARNLVYQNQHDAAMNLLVNLENSSNRQVQVRAKYLIGEVLFNQGSYDQAMQVFEGIVENFAFSGVVFHALTKLVACTHKLKLTEKYQRYYSMLHDIFQST